MRLEIADLKKLNPEMFQVFDVRNALLTAGDAEHCNTMTIGWYQLGWIWNLPVCTVYVRPERYTYEFMESKDYFTLNVLPASEKKTMGLCGGKSGRDVDKIKECGLTLRTGMGDAPFFDEAELVLVCKKAYVQDLDPACAVDKEAILPHYGEKGGLHRAYTGVVVEVYTKED